MRTIIWKVELTQIDGCMANNSSKHTLSRFIIKPNQNNSQGNCANIFNLWFFGLAKME